MTKKAAKKSKPEKPAKAVKAPKPKKPPKKKKLSAGAKADLLDSKLSELSAAKNVYAMSVLEWNEAHAHAVASA